MTNICDPTSYTEQPCFNYIHHENAASAPFVNSSINMALEGPPTGTTDADIRLFSIVLYSEDHAAWANFLSINAGTAIYNTLVDNYSGYTMFWYCSLEGTLNSTKEGSGCCLRDQGDHDGGYCIEYVSSSVVQTYYMSDADYVTATTVNPNNLPVSAKVTETNDNRGFEAFKCEILADEWMQCYKFQLYHGNTSSIGHRFDTWWPANDVRAFYFDAQQTDDAKWTMNKRFNLQGATQLVVAASALTAMLLTF